MTVSEIHIAIKQGIDKTSNLTSTSFEPEEIDYWFNKVQDDFVDNLCRDIIEGKSILSTEEYLSPLLSNSYITLTLDTGRFNGRLYRGILNSIAIINPNQHRHLLQVAVFGNRVLEDGTSVTNKFMRCTKINPATELSKYLTTNDNVPYFNEPVYFINRGQLDISSSNVSIGVLVDAFTTSLTTGEVILVKNPTAIDKVNDVTTNLPNVAVRKIIDLTVLNMLENIESRRIQTNAALLGAKI